MKQFFFNRNKIIKIALGIPRLSLFHRVCIHSHKNGKVLLMFYVNRWDYVFGPEKDFISVFIMPTALFY